ncbi:MAG TPA: hypothetical protein VHL34_01965 [Rhizomicrobium sp.]|jgi:hypothetical protein|nr:hypothetical protein [Rhizomicrobium sp.]
MRTRKLSTIQIVYLVLLVLSAIAGAYSGYRWESETPGGQSVAMLSGHSWFTDHLGLSAGLGCTFGRAAGF